jgi:hypothetical protein
VGVKYVEERKETLVLTEPVDNLLILR